MDKVYKLTCQYESDGVWKPFDADIISKNGDLIEGVEQEEGKSPHIIKGIFIPEKKQLAFLRLTNEFGIHPEVFIFNKIEEEGIWDRHDIFNGFLENGKVQGKAKVIVEASDSLIAPRVATAFLHNYLLSKGVKKLLLDQCEGYLSFNK